MTAVAVALLILGGGIGSTSTYAQPSFENVASLEGVRSASADWGDFNNDGRLDLAITGKGAGTKIYENTGGGSFSAIGASNIVDPPFDAVLSWGDYNGDGNLDLAIAADTNDVNFDDPPITKVYEGDGTGSFTELGAGLVGVDRGDVEWGDYNNDGYDDLIVAGSDTTVVYPGSSDGLDSGVGASDLVDIGLDAAVAWGDYNGDGRDDLVITGDDESGTPVTTVYRSESGDVFTEVASLLPGVSDGGTDWGDYNGDGQPDLVVAGADGSIDSRTTVYRNDGGGSFTQVFTEMGAGFTGDADWGDYDGDGNLDFVAIGDGATVGSQITRVYRGDGTGGFRKIRLSSIESRDFTEGEAKWGDYNNDGRDELVQVGYSSDGSFSETQDAEVYRVRPFTLTSTSPAPNAPSAPSTDPITLDFSSDVGPVNGDDVVVQGDQSGGFPGTVSTSGGELTYTPSSSFAPGEDVQVTVRVDSLESTALVPLDSTVTFEFTADAAPALAEFPTKIEVATSESGARAVAAGDLDRDGDRDLVVGSEQEDGSVVWYANQGGGSFGGGTDLDSDANNPRDLVLADLSGNDSLDVVVVEGNGAESSDDALTWYENDGSGGFLGGQTIQSSSPLDDPRAVAAGDVDGDGDVDLVTASRENSRVVLHENDGTGGFSTTQIDQPGNAPRSIALADVDGNGTLDVIIGEASNDEVSWYSNDGTGGAGAFSGSSLITSSQTAPTAVATADLDEDQAPEVLVASEGDDTVAWYDYTGSDWTSGGTLTSSADSASAVHPADLTGNGELDVLVAAGQGNSLTAFVNEGGATFSGGRTFDTGAQGVQDVTAADLDGDGRLDPAAASFDDGTVSYYPNRRELSLVYVDQSATGADDGTSWADALPSLQDAFALAGVGDTIVVAEGTYYPDEGVSASDGDRTASFTLADSMKVYGGFSGSEGNLSGNLSAALSNRDLEVNETILSGDVDGDNGLTGNSYHVLAGAQVLSSQTKVDGFTIQGGNANDDTKDLDGDGRVDADKGGGMYLNGRGGPSTPRLSNLVFRNNAASDRGGGLYLDAYGGGIVSPELANVTFANNEAPSGGAMAIQTAPEGESLGGTSTPLIANAVFRGNQATDEFGDGGAISLPPTTFNVTTAPIFSHVTIVNNSAGGQGGGIGGRATGAFVHNSVLWGNTAGGSSSQIDDVSGITVQNSLVEGSGGSGSWSFSSVIDEGGNIDADPLLVDPAGGNARLNWASPVMDEGASQLQVSETTQIVIGDSADVDNDGDVTEALPVDRDGNQRALGPNPDMGAYEGGAVPTTPVAYVDTTGADTGSAGESWTDPYRTLQAGLMAAENRQVAGNPFDRVQVAEGAYYPDEGPGVTDGDVTTSFQLVSDTDVLGGYPSGGGPRDAREHPTVLSGDVDQDDTINENGVTVAPADTTGTNSVHVVSMQGGGSARLDGFVVTAGQAGGATTTSEGRGGGIYVEGSDPTLQNLRVQGNWAAGDGGAIHARSFSGVRVRETILRNNEAGQRGGGLFVRSSTVAMERSRVQGNRANRGGGVAFQTDTDAQPDTLRSVTLSGNTADGTGGGLWTAGPESAIVYNSVLTGNEANSGAGIHVATDGATTVTNSTFSNNTAGDAGGAVLVDGTASTQAHLQNTILWDNTASSGSEVQVAADATVTFEIGDPLKSATSILEGGGSGIGGTGTVAAERQDTLSADPIFVDPDGPDGTPGTADDDLRLNWASPAIEGGAGQAHLDASNTSSPTIATIAQDRAGTPRVRGRSIEIGAYEGGAAPTETSVVYADSASGADADSSGGSWSDPYRTPQAALAAAEHAKRNQSGVPFDEVWVAEGTYYPDEGPGIPADSAAFSFPLVDSVAVYGGFQNGDSFGNRDPDANRTILSGDIDQDADTSGNSRVVVGASTLGFLGAQTPVSRASVLDGFTITGGTNTAGGAAGVQLSSRRADVSPTLRNLRIVENFGELGAGLGAFGEKSPAGPGDETGSIGTIRPLLVDVDFIANEAIGEARVGGGASFVGRGGTVEADLVNVRFLGNRAAQAGAFAVSASGGGRAGPTMANVLLSGNVAEPDSAAVLFQSVEGGAESTFGTVEPRIVNTTWGRNAASADSLDELIEVRGQDSDVDVRLANSVLGENAARAVAGGVTSAVTIDSSVVDGGWGGAGSGVVDANPRYVNPTGPDGTAGTVDDSLQVLGTSPALNQGGTSLLPPDVADLDADDDVTEALSRDLGGEDRVLTGQVDAGAYEGAASPSVRLRAATNVADNSADLSGTVVPYAASADVTFEVEPTDGGTVQTFSPESSVSGTDSVDVSVTADSLQPNTAYAYRLVADDGTRATGSSVDTFATLTVRLAAQPDTIRVGAVQVGQRGRETDVTVENVGEATLTGLEASFEGPAAEDFRVEEGFSDGGLSTGAERAARVSFAPAAVGRREAALVVRSAEGGRDTTRLLGRGAALAVQANGLEGGAVERGDPAEVRLEARGGVEVVEGSLRVRKGGDRVYQSFALSETDRSVPGDTIELAAQVPDTLVTTRGIDYYAVLAGAPGLGGTVDQRDTLTVPAGGVEAARQRPAHLPVQFDSLQAPVQVRPEAYRMVTVPARPEGGIKQALRETYGAYDRTVWRVLQWEAAAGSYQEYPDIDSLKSGTGFWLIAADGEELELGTGQTAGAENPRRIPLEAGWNQVGSPFGYAVPWDTVRSASGLSASAVDGPVGYGPEGYERGQSVLDAWTGYFVFSTKPDTLVVPPVGTSGGEAARAKTGLPALAGTQWSGASPRESGTSGSGAATTSSSTPTSSRSADARTTHDEPVAGAVLTEGTPPTPNGQEPTEQGAMSSENGEEKTAPRQEEGASEAARYTLRLEVQARGQRPSRVWLGLRSSAEAGRGPLDFAQVPPIGQGLRLSALEKVAGQMVPHAGSFEPIRSDGHVWELRVTNPSNEKARTARIGLKSEGDLPAGQRRYVLDVSEERRLAPGGRLELDGGETRRLKVIVGTEAFAESKSEGIELTTFKNGLRGNYPNPFGEETTLAYTLEEEREVRIEIYDVLGRRVRTLVRGEKQEAGLHEVQWRGQTRYGTPAGSGVYFYRIEAGDFTETRKMVLVR